MIYSLSAVLIVPDAHRDEASAVAEAVGWGPGNYSVPLSSDGTEPATHWLCRAQVDSGFPDRLDNPVEEAEALMEHLIIDVCECGPQDAGTHVDAVLTAQGLQKVVVGP